MPRCGKHLASGVDAQLGRLSGAKRAELLVENLNTHRRGDAKLLNECHELR
jgi:hypothetical protein